MLLYLYLFFIFYLLRCTLCTIRYFWIIYHWVVDHGIHYPHQNVIAYQVRWGDNVVNNCLAPIVIVCLYSSIEAGAGARNAREECSYTMPFFQRRGCVYC